MERKEQTGRIEDLQGLLDRLCAPDLTLTEAEVLRSRLADLLNHKDRAAS